MPSNRNWHQCFWIIVDRSCTRMHLSKQIERYKLCSTPIEIGNSIKAFAFDGTRLPRCLVKLSTMTLMTLHLIIRVALPMRSRLGSSGVGKSWRICRTIVAGDEIWLLHIASHRTHDSAKKFSNSKTINWLCCNDAIRIITCVAFVTPKSKRLNRLCISSVLQH